MRRSAQRHFIPTTYSDGRPAAKYRIEAKDAGAVLKHGHGPARCDLLGARDVWVSEHKGRFYMNYDGAGPKGWVACLATSEDLEHWEAQGPVLKLGPKRSPDSASASYLTTFFDGQIWHGYYLGTPHASPAPDFIPRFPYLTMKAIGASPAGPWRKRRGLVPFRPSPGTYYASVTSPGHIIQHGDEYLMFFSASVELPSHKILRTLGIARSQDLNGRWKVDPTPILPLEEQIENSSLHFEEATQVWFLFTNHVGVSKDSSLEYTDAIWVYWSRDVNSWHPANKAVVLDGKNCQWSKHIIGLPSVLKVGRRLALFYDGNGARHLPLGVKSHMNRDIALAWIDLPLRPPAHLASPTLPVRARLNCPRHLNRSNLGESILSYR